MKKQTIAGMVAAALCTMAFAGTALADHPEKDKVKVRGLAANGTGCPMDTVTPLISEDNEAFTLLFSKFGVAVSPDANLRAMDRQVCTVAVDLEVPPGWSYSVAKTTVSAFASLDDLVRARVNTRARFQGQTDVESTAHLTLTGSLEKNFTVTDVFPVENWSPCGGQRQLLITTEARIDNRRNPDGEGVLEVDSMDGEFKTVYGIQWRRCE